MLFFSWVWKRQTPANPRPDLIETLGLNLIDTGTASSPPGHCLAQATKVKPLLRRLPNYLLKFAIRQIETWVQHAEQAPPRKDSVQIGLTVGRAVFEGSPYTTRIASGGSESNPSATCPTSTAAA